MAIYGGPLGIAKALQASLESAGFFAFIPGENVKTLDPFITGANSLTVSLQVPDTEAEAAREFLANPYEPIDEEDPLDRRARSIRSRILWGLLIQLWNGIFPIPVPLCFAMSYRRIVAEMESPPWRHVSTCVALIASLVVLVFQVLFWVLIFSVD